MTGAPLKLRDGVLYAAEFELGKKARPVRVLDHRQWCSYSSPTLGGFEWRPGPGDRKYRATVGVACLYWSNTPAEPTPDPQALLDFPWEPLPADPRTAAEELQQRANSDVTGPASKQAHGSWLCLRPVARHQIVCAWEDYDFEKLQEERRLEHGRRLLAWDEINRRLSALGLTPVNCDAGGFSAPFSTDQVTALLDRAEQVTRPGSDALGGDA
jgi:hypothetical protein